MGQKTEKIFERAQSNLQQDKHEHALRLFNEVLNRQPSHKKALRSKAFIKILKSDYKEAEEFLQFAIEQRPQDDQLHQMLGTLYHNNEKPLKALALFKKATELNNSNTAAQRGLGMLYAHVIGEHEKAITHFSYAIDLSNDKADLFFNRGCSYMILEKMDEAESDFRKAGELGHDKAQEMVNKYFN